MSETNPIPDWAKNASLQHVPSSDTFLPAEQPVAEENIDALRKRLAEGWTKWKRKEAHKRWRKLRGHKLDLNNLYDPQDSFVKWVTAQPEGALRIFAAQRDAQAQANCEKGWKRAFQGACVAIFRCSFVPDTDANGNVTGGTMKKISVADLEADEVYREHLDEGAQLVARFLVERCQTQKAGVWTFTRAILEDWVRLDKFTAEDLAGLNEPDVEA